MALPKKPRKRIEAALDTISNLNPNPPKSSLTSKPGRPKTVDHDRERISLYISPDTLFELDQVVTKLKHVKKSQGKRIDRSLLIEIAVKNWLESDQEQLAI